MALTRMESLERVGQAATKLFEEEMQKRAEEGARNRETNGGLIVELSAARGTIKDLRDIDARRKQELADVYQWWGGLWKAHISKEPALECAKMPELAVVLRTALVNAVQTIRDSYDIRLRGLMTFHLRAEVWRIYYNNSPEMAKIRELLGPDPTVEPT